MVLRKALLLILFAAVGATISSAQTTRDHTVADPRMKATVEDLPDGQTLFTVQNRSAQTITALALEGTRTMPPPKRGSGKVVRYFDSVANLGHDPELGPYQSHTFVIFGKSPSPLEASRDVELKAVLFADGTSYGDPVWVNKLEDSRKFLSECIGDISQKLNAALASNEPSQTLAGELKEGEAVQMKGAASLDERVIANRVYEGVICYLSASDLEDVPEANRIRVQLDQFRNQQAALASALPAK
jgi:hypothetical protein